MLGAAFTLKYLSQINTAEEEGLLDLNRMRLNSFPLEMWVRIFGGDVTKLPPRKRLKLIARRQVDF